TTTNMSTKAGVPVAATLTINIAMRVNSQVIMEDSKVYGFAAGETHTFEFPVTVPMETGGKSGAAVAEVFDPNGYKIANGSLDIVIASIAPALGMISLYYAGPSTSEWKVGWYNPETGGYPSQIPMTNSASQLIHSPFSIQPNIIIIVRPYISPAA
ncbi:unnamed protein product, partial [marine sediment metagenome]